jgi:poly(A) polymerase
MDMFGLAPSKPVGILKNALKDAILDGIIPNTYENAYTYLVEKAKEMDLKIKKS